MQPGAKPGMSNYRRHAIEEWKPFIDIFRDSKEAENDLLILKVLAIEARLTTGEISRRAWPEDWKAHTSVVFRRIRDLSKKGLVKHYDDTTVRGSAVPRYCLTLQGLSIATVASPEVGANLAHVWEVYSPLYGGEASSKVRVTFSPWYLASLLQKKGFSQAFIGWMVLFSLRIQVKTGMINLSSPNSEATADQFVKNYFPVWQEFKKLKSGVPRQFAKEFERLQTLRARDPDLSAFDRDGAVVMRETEPNATKIIRAMGDMFHEFASKIETLADTPTVGALATPEKTRKGS